MKRCILLFCLASTGCLQAQRAVQKNPNTGALIEGFSTGANTLTISATGTLTWTSGATLGGASHFLTSAGFSANGQSLVSAANYAAMRTLLDLEPGVDYVAYSVAMASLQSKAGEPSGYMLYTTGTGAYDARDMSNVENTALSTWSGSTNLTTLGTISAGTWNGTAIGVSYGGTGSTTAAGARVALLPSLTGNGGKVLAVNAGATDVEWITAASGGGLTIGTTTITSGTSGRVLYDNAGVVGEMTGITLSAGALSSAAFGAGSAASPSVTFGDANTGIYGDASDNVYFSTGGFLRWYIDSLGTWQGGGNSVQFTGNLLCAYVYNRGGWYSMGASDDTISQRIAADHWAHARSTNAQRLSVTNTYSSATNLESFTIDWQTTTNTCRIGTVKGSGGGTARDLIIQTDGTTRITISASGEIFMTLPTSAGTSGSLWNDSGTVKVAP